MCPATADPRSADREEGDTVILLAWEAGRPRPLYHSPWSRSTPDLLRQAGARAQVLPPRCDACGTPLDLPACDERLPAGLAS